MHYRPGLLLGCQTQIQKSDLSIRPIWHQKKERVQAHILVCFLAFVLWKTLARVCVKAGLGDKLRRVLDEIAQIMIGDVVLPTREGREIRRQSASGGGRQSTSRYYSNTWA